jgi:hypothetical protein
MTNALEKGHESGLTPTLDTISCSHTLDPWTREYKPGLMTDGISSLG